MSGARGTGSIPGSGRSLEVIQQSTPVFSAGESRGQRSLVGSSPRGRRELDTTEHAPSLSQNRMRGVQQGGYAQVSGVGEMPVKSWSHHTPSEGLAASQKPPTCLCPITVVGMGFSTQICKTSHGLRETVKGTEVTEP